MVVMRGVAGGGQIWGVGARLREGGWRGFC